ncbi:MAG: ribonuclease III [Fibromonadaceae bacterium]|jgi:ribonuclease-3|nr:ribonuclease III [Fibromonadaceae bacterium]
MHNLEQTLACSFKDKGLLRQAFIHGSRKLELSLSDSETYERLEFLGDSVVNFLTTEFLFLKYGEENEGCLAKKKSAMVSRTALAQAARNLNLSSYLICTDGMDRENPAILADLFESLIGAVYLDSGIEKCREIVTAFLFSIEAEILQSEVFQNPKTLLNEKAQELDLGTPVYELLDEWGEIHKREFKVAVSAGGKRLGTGTGFSKKEAEQNAAKEALDISLFF